MKKVDQILQRLVESDICQAENVEEYKEELMQLAGEVAQPNLSHHLRILENEGLVNRTKKGKWVYCSLANRKIVENMIKNKIL